MKTVLAILLAGSAAPALAQTSGSTAPAQSGSATCTPEHAAMGHCTLPSTNPPPVPVDPHAGHNMPAQPPQQQVCTPEHAAMGHCTVAASPPQARPKAASKASGNIPARQQLPDCTPEHAAMGHCTLPSAAPQPTPATDPRAGHSMPAPPPQQPACAPEHAAMGHCTPSAPSADPHAGHAETSAAPPITPPPAAAYSGPEHAADAVYAPTEMAEAREELRREHGALPAYKVFFDRIESVINKGPNSYLIEGQAWYGGDIDKFWLKTEVEGEFGGGIEEAEIQGLWSHAINPWFDLQTGVRYDPRSGPDRAHLVLGIQGLAPYWWEVDGTFFLSNKGEVTARAEAEYDLRITQKLIFQPRAELDLSFQDLPELHIGAGLTTGSVGARLRYQITPLFAPYVGLEYERSFGDTRRFLRQDGEDAGGLSVLGGIRVWF